jgi:putative hydrolase of the HAD superfamily
MNLVFDFGAVLFTWQPDEILRDWFPRHAQSPQQAKTLAADVFHHPDWQAFDQGTLALDDVVQRTSRRLALDSAKFGALVAQIPDRLTPIEDTVQLLRDLAKRRKAHGDITLHFLSNMPSPFARTLEQRHAFLDLFEGGIFSGDVQLIKPQPEIFALLQTRFGLDPGQTLFIDDLKSNVHAAQACGWQAVQFETAQQLQQHLAHWL